MENINLDKEDFNNLLATVEILIGDVEQMMDQKKVVNMRMNDIKSGKVIGKTEKDYNDYIKKRGIAC